MVHWSWILSHLSKTLIAMKLYWKKENWRNYKYNLPNLELQEFFNLRCLANKVTPKTLQIKWKGNKFEQAIIKKAECSLIQNRIKCTNIKINYLQTEIANTEMSLQQKLDEPTFTNLQNVILNNKQKTFLQYKNTQIKSLKHLIPRSSTTTSKMASRSTNTFNTAVTSFDSSNIQDKWVINLFTTERPKICSYPSNHPLKEYISTTTVAVLQAGELNGVDCSGLYHDANGILNTFANKSIHKNIKKSEYLALENLRKDKDHIIVTAHKGVALVVTDKTRYIQNVKPSYKTTQFISISLKTHFQLSTKNSLKFCKNYKKNNFISETQIQPTRTSWLLFPSSKI